jgi:hypothetical protein
MQLYKRCLSGSASIAFVLLATSVMEITACGTEENEGEGKAGTNCKNLKCTAPEVCDDSSGEAICVCPDGYEGNDSDSGARCLDIDECARKLDNCVGLAVCVNTPGSFRCMCPTPAYRGDSTNCQCADGYHEEQGQCIADGATACQQDGNCATGHCVGGVCCANACDSPNECQTSEGATCADGVTCVYPKVEDNGQCDDGNPCTDDSCDETSGCVHNNNDASCEDGDECTTDDACVDGECIAGTNLDCDDELDCTDDYCDANTGCVHTPNDWLCDDENECTDDSCDPETGDSDTGCVHENNDEWCDDGFYCTADDTCDDGECIPGPDRSCDDGNVCHTGTCSEDLGCVYVTNTEADECDDGNPCTDGDHCVDGQCTSTAPLVCADDGNLCTTESCDPQDTTGSPCRTTDNSDPCDDLDSCTTTDVCSDGGCSGSGNACGVHATDCTEGTPNTCTCETLYVDRSGTCVPSDYECDYDPCDTHATCYDPSNTADDVECTCNLGYTGDGFKVAGGGTGCTDINECAGDPCGIGDERASACNQPTPGTYTCSCTSGYTPVDSGNGPTCVCDMNGTFALDIKTHVIWSDIDYVEDVTEEENATNESWALINQTYDADGTLSIETTSCGQITIDVCGLTNLLVKTPEAYAEFFPIEDFELSSMPNMYCENPNASPPCGMSLSLPNALPGQAYLTPQTASLLGIHLTDPFGDWPAKRTNISGGGGTVTNGAQWLDHDNDTALGVTSYSVPPGGIKPGDISGETPPKSYGAKSSACPRSDDDADRLSYAWWPANSGLNLYRIKRFYMASRVISQFSGSITSCNRIDGNVIGPDNGQMRSDSRYGGCIRCSSGSGASCSDQACSDTIVGQYDVDPTQEVVSSTFVMKRVSNSSTCADVRALDYD